jgi:hypothetical protein
MELMIRGLAELVGSDEMAVIDRERRERRAKEKFHGPLKQLWDIEV